MKRNMGKKKMNYCCKYVMTEGTTAFAVSTSYCKLIWHFFPRKIIISWGVFVHDYLKLGFYIFVHTTYLYTVDIFRLYIIFNS